MSERLALGSTHQVTLGQTPAGWSVTPEHADGTPCLPGEGAAEALLAMLRDPGDLADRWQILRLAPAPQVSGERAITVDQTNTSVVVGDRVIVKWLRSVTDEAQPSLAALAQLSAVGFEQMPTSYAVLTWTSPAGRALPVAYVSEHLTGAEDGWTWCLELARSIAREGGDGGDPWAADFPARLGRLAAELHVALATPSHVFPHPIQPAGTGRVQRWSDGALAMLADALTVTDPESVSVVRARAGAIAARFEATYADETGLAGTPVQHIHGDLHVGQVLRRAASLSVIDFDGNPVAPAGGGVLHPVARDLAQLLRSLDHVGQIVLYRNPELSAEAVRRWLPQARTELLTAYRDALQKQAMRYLLDDRLLPAFELEQELRELVYADRYLPGWAYAPRGSLRDLLDDERNDSGD